jgi:hypothetical protein
MAARYQSAVPIDKKTNIKEWVAIAVSLVMWFASVTYMAGVLGQRVTELEQATNLLRDNTMSKDMLTEKFDGISLRLKSLEEVQKELQRGVGVK